MGPPLGGTGTSPDTQHLCELSGLVQVLALGRLAGVGHAYRVPVAQEYLCDLANRRALHLTR
jgi:hypothetical protein